MRLFREPANALIESQRGLDCWEREIMKVIIVAPYFYPRVGGAEVYTLNIARQLKALGWQVVIVTTAAAAKDELALRGLVEMPVYYLNQALRVSNTPVGLSWRRELRRIYRAERPDLINAHTPVPYLADVAQRASESIPFALTYHNDLEKSSLPYKVVVKILHRTLIDKTLRQSTHIITTSDYYARNSIYLRPYMPKISVVPPGVDVSRFNPGVKIDHDLAQRYEGKHVLLFVGSLNRSHQHKGLDVLMESFSLIHRDWPDVSLVVVGGGDAIGDYRSIAARNGFENHIEFTGYVDDERLAQYYKLARIFIMPSTNRSEGFGMAYIEANAVGTPVIGSRVGGVPYAVLDNETGLLVEPKSVDEIYEAVRTLLTDDDLSERLGASGAMRVRAEFDWVNLGKQTSDIFMKLCGDASD
jgi:glycosyltransferase involved in cell wall biosynthesis